MNLARALLSLRYAAAVAALFGGVVVGPACETYDSPPRPELEGIVDGVLPNREAPIVIVFSEPIVPETLKVQIMELEVDVEGNLYDEDADESTLPNTFLGYDPVTLNNFGGTDRKSTRLNSSH